MEIVRKRFRRWFILFRKSKRVTNSEQLRLALLLEVDVEYIQKWIHSERRKLNRIQKSGTKDPLKDLRLEKLKYFFNNISIYPSQKDLSDFSSEFKYPEKKIRKWFVRNRYLKKKSEINVLSVKSFNIEKRLDSF